MQSQTAELLLRKSTRSVQTFLEILYNYQIHDGQSVQISMPSNKEEIPGFQHAPEQELRREQKCDREVHTSQYKKGLL